eukprot:scaffold28658_cov60-Phaeocystis_antarctica.AAC.1
MPLTALLPCWGDLGRYEAHSCGLPTLREYLSVCLGRRDFLGRRCLVVPVMLEGRSAMLEGKELPPAPSKEPVSAAAAESKYSRPSSREKQAALDSCGHLVPSARRAPALRRAVRGAAAAERAARRARDGRERRLLRQGRRLRGHVAGGARAGAAR